MIELTYMGHLGNNLFSYALARYLSEELGHALTCKAWGSGPWGDIEERSGIVDKLPAHVGLFEDAVQTRPGREIQAPQMRYVSGEKLGWQAQSINLPHILRAGRDHRIVLRGYFQRAEYYMPFADRIRKWYRMRPMDVPVKPGPGDVMVHVRRSLDMRVLDRRLDVSFYVKALQDLNPNRVYVCGIGLDATIREALKPWNPTWLDLDAGKTLYLMTRFPRIVAANSTFSWWGAFLSEAERIVFPFPDRGFLSPDTADVNLRVPEARWTFVDDVPLETWRFLRCAPRWNHLRVGENLVVQIPGEMPATLPASRPLEALLKWLPTVRGDFGCHELNAAGLGTRQQLAETLLDLLECGLLQECNGEAKDPPLGELLMGRMPFGDA